VRCHRFLKGENVLQLAWVGLSPVVAVSTTGAPLNLPAIDERRDGSGTTVNVPIGSIGTRKVL
jgi:DNA gyrase subunit A